LHIRVSVLLNDVDDDDDDDDDHISWVTAACEILFRRLLLGKQPNTLYPMQSKVATCCRNCNVEAAIDSKCCLNFE